MSQLDLLRGHFPVPCELAIIPIYTSIIQILVACSIATSLHLPSCRDVVRSSFPGIIKSLHQADLGAVQFEQYLSNAADTQTTIARAQRYSKGTEIFTWIPPTTPNAITMADYSMQSAISYGLVQQYDTVVQQTSFKCPSGNCTWSSFESLAVCSVCNNLTDQLTAYAAPNNLWVDLNPSQNPFTYVTPNATTIRLPNGLFINNVDGLSYTAPAYSMGGYGFVYMTTLGTGNASKTNSLEDNDSLIWAMSILKVQEASNSSLTWPNIPVEGIECGLSTVSNSITPQYRTESCKRQKPTSVPLVETRIRGNPNPLRTSLLIMATYRTPPKSRVWSSTLSHRLIQGQT